MSKQNSFQQVSVILPHASPYPDTAAFPERLAELLTARGAAPSRGVLAIARDVATALVGTSLENKPTALQVLTLVVLDDIDYAVVPFGHKVIAFSEHKDWKLFVGHTLPMHLTLPTLGEDSEGIQEERSRSRRLTFELARMYDQRGKDINATLNDIQRCLELDNGRGYDVGLVTPPEQLIAQVRTAWGPSGLQSLIDNLDNNVTLTVGRYWKDGIENKLNQSPMSLNELIMTMPVEWHIRISKVPVDIQPWSKRS